MWMLGVVVVLRCCLGTDGWVGDDWVPHVRGARGLQGPVAVHFDFEEAQKV
jgi:hypothetical protein